MARTVGGKTALNVNDLLEGHVALDLECLDRLYLNAYIPNLQVGGQVVPLLRPKKGERQIDLVRPLAAKAKPGVVAILVTQELQWVFSGHKRPTDAPGAVNYGFEKAERRVTCFCFYVLDEDFGLGFVKIASYFPYPAKVWVNGHEWAKRQAARAGPGFTELANGFAACDDPEALQRLCDRLGPAGIQAFFDRWTDAVPTPLPRPDDEGGHWWELSMRQVEASRTIVFDAPAGPGGSSKPWWPTTWGPAAPTR